MLRYILLINILSYGLCYENHKTDILEDFSGSGINDIDFVNVSQPFYSNHSKLGKPGKEQKKATKHYSVKLSNSPKKTKYNITYGNLSVTSEKSLNSNSKYINPILLTFSCTFFVIGSVLILNKYYKKRGYNLVDTKNYNTFQNI